MMNAIHYLDSAIQTNTYVMNEIEKAYSTQHRARKYFNLSFMPSLQVKSKLLCHSWAPTAIQYLMISSLLLVKANPIYATTQLIFTVASLYLFRKTPSKLYQMYARQSTSTKIQIVALSALILVATVNEIVLSKNIGCTAAYFLPTVSFLYISTHLIFLDAAQRCNTVTSVANKQFIMLKQLLNRAA